MVWFGAWRVNGSLSVSRAIGRKKTTNFVSPKSSTSLPCVNFDMKGLEMLTYLLRVLITV